MLARFVYLNSAALVDFYTIEVAEHEEEEWVQLFNRFLEQGLIGPGSDKARTIMLAWIKNIGRYGADRLEIRAERDAGAIPPKSVRGRKIAGDDSGVLLQAFQGFPVPRLYLSRFGRAIILLDGGMKTQNKAQDCPIVGPKFELANRICRSLDLGMKRTDFRILPSGKLEIPDEFTFEVVR